MLHTSRGLNTWRREWINHKFIVTYARKLSFQKMTPDISILLAIHVRQGQDRKSLRVKLDVLIFLLTSIFHEYDVSSVCLPKSSKSKKAPFLWLHKTRTRQLLSFHNMMQAFWKSSSTVRLWQLLSTIELKFVQMSYNSLSSRRAECCCRVNFYTNRRVV